MVTLYTDYKTALSCSDLTHAQDFDFDELKSDVRTNVPATARYKIIRSPMMLSWVFRLDKFTGRIYQLIIPLKGRHFWKEVPVENLPKSTALGKPIYQIFIAGKDVRQTLLINTDTGQSWVLAVDTLDNGEKSLIWAIFDAP